MYVMVVGLNHRTAPVEYRERINYAEEALGKALNRLKDTKSILESVILSTCNRTEIYAVVDQHHTGEHFIKRFIAESFQMNKEEIIPFLYVKQDNAAVEHLFRVITGLDSMILGETQILGQIRQAFFAAQKENATGTIFNTLFKQAITFAKKAHTETGIGENAVSVSYAAVELTKKIFDRLDNKHAVLIGAGETSELTALHLISQGIKHISVVNRSFEAAVTLANSFKGKAYPFEELYQAMEQADIVISSTSASDKIVKKSFVMEMMKNRAKRPLFLIDLAVPRDIETEVTELDNIYLYDIDDLQEIVDENLEERRKLAELIKSEINQEVYSFYQWVNTLGVIPLITALREKSLQIQEETMKSINNKLPHLSEKEVSTIRKHTKSIINQMLKNPIIRMKEMADEPNSEVMMEFFKKIFAIEEEEIKPNPVYNSMLKELEIQKELEKKEQKKYALKNIKI